MRLRLRYTKVGKIRFISHRDVARLWERALRRASVPVAYSEGFSPHPRLSFGLALSVGHESLGEYLDADLAEPVDIERIPARLAPALPLGIEVQRATEIEPGTLSLQQAVVRCTWRIEVGGTDPADLSERLAHVLAADELVTTRERKGRPVTEDVRPAVLSAGIEPGSVTETGSRTVVADLATQPRGLRPAELVALLGDDLAEEHVCRVHQWIDADGALVEPLPFDPGATSPHAELRAS